MHGEPDACPPASPQEVVQLVGTDAQNSPLLALATRIGREERRSTGTERTVRVQLRPTHAHPRGVRQRLPGEHAALGGGGDGIRRQVERRPEPAVEDALGCRKTAEGIAEGRVRAVAIAIGRVSGVRHPGYSLPRELLRDLAQCLAQRLSADSRPAARATVGGALPPPPPPPPPPPAPP